MTPTGPSNAVIVERVDNLSKDLQKIEALLNRMNEGLTASQIDNVQVHEKLTSITNEANERSKKNETTIDKVECDLRGLEKVVARNADVIGRLMRWGIALGTPTALAIIAGVSAFVWSLITHQVAIVTPSVTPIP